MLAAVKLQELFGLAETPRVGPRREPVVFELLAPNGRPVQTTRDLRSFWERTYPEVRKELRGRYPQPPVAGRSLERRTDAPRKKPALTLPRSRILCAGSAPGPKGALPGADATTHPS